MSINCPKCDAVLEPSDSACPKCGVKLETDLTDMGGTRPRGTIKFSDLESAAPPLAQPLVPPTVPPAELHDESEDALDGDSASEIEPGTSPSSTEILTSSPQQTPSKPTESSPPVFDAAATQLIEQGSSLDSRLTAYWAAASPSGSTPVSTLQGGDLRRDYYVPLDLPIRSIVQKSTGEQEADYLRISLIAEGGMGEVHLAEQVSVRRQVALKFLRLEKNDSEDKKSIREEKFLTEAAIMGELSHPNILPVFEVGKSTDDELFYSMKYIRGTSWEEAWSRRSLSENLQILLKVSDAVAFAHSKNIVHRDIKPENVMLGDFGEVVLADWGIALDLKHDHNFPLSGSPAYASPEIVCGPCSAIGKHTDIYLLGATLFQLIVGKAPHYFSEDYREVVHHAARNDILPVPEEKEGGLIDIAMRAMATKPQNRYRTIESFQQAIKQFQTHEESVTIANQAFEDLDAAKDNRDPNAYSRSMFGFENALGLWPGNQRALLGLRTAREDYAKHALEVEDYDQGLAVLDPDDYSHKELYEKLEKGKVERDSRRSRLKTTRWALFIAVGFAAVFAIVGLVFTTIKEQQVRKLDNKYQTDVAKYEKDVADFKTEVTNTNEELKLQRSLNESTAANLKKTADDLSKTADDLKNSKDKLKLREDELKQKQDDLEEEKRRVKQRDKTIVKERATAIVSLIKSRIDEDDVTYGANQLPLLRQDEISKSQLGWESLRLEWMFHEVDSVLPEEVKPDVIACSTNWLVTIENSPNGADLKLWKLDRNSVSVDAAKPFVETNISGMAARCAKISSTGEFLAVGGKPAQPGAPYLKIFQLTNNPNVLEESFTRQLLTNAELQKLSASRRRTEQQYEVRDLDFDRTGRALAVAGRIRRTVGFRTPYYLLKFDAGSWTKVLPNGRNNAQGGTGHRIDISPDGSFALGIASGPQEIAASAIESLYFGKSDVAPMPPCRLRGSFYNDVAISPDGRQYLAATQDGKVVVSSSQEETPAIDLYGHTRPVRHVSFAGNNRIVSSGDDRAVLTWARKPDDKWSASTVAEATRLRGHSESVLDSQIIGESAAASIDRNGNVLLWNIASYHDQIRILPEGDTEEAHIAASEDGQRIVVADANGLLRVFDGSNSAQPGSKKKSAVDAFVGHEQSINSEDIKMATCFENEKPMFVTFDGSTLCLWDGLSGVWLDRKNWLDSESAKKGTLFATRPGGADVIVGSSSTIVWFVVKNQKLVRQPGSEIQNLFASQLALQPNGAGVSVSFFKETKKMMSYQSLKSGSQSLEQPESISLQGCRITYSPDGEYILGARDGRLLAWNHNPTNTSPMSVEVPGSVKWLRAPINPQLARLLVYSQQGNERGSVQWVNVGDNLGLNDVTPGLYSTGDVSPDGSFVALLSKNGQPVTWQEGRGAQPLNLNSATAQSYRDLRFLSNDHILAHVSNTEPREVFGQILKLAPEYKDAEAARIASRSPLLAVVVTSDGTSATTFSRAGVAYVWDLTNPGGPRLSDQSHLGSQSSVDDVATAGDSVYLRQGSELHWWSVTDLKQRTGPLASDIVAMCASGDGRGFCLLKSGEVQVFDRGKLSSKWNISPVKSNDRPALMAATESGEVLAILTDSGLKVRRLQGDQWEEVVLEGGPERAKVEAMTLAPAIDAGDFAQHRLLFGDSLGSVSVWQIMTSTSPEESSDNSDAPPKQGYQLRQMFGWIAHKHAVASLRFERVGNADCLLSTSDNGDVCYWPANPPNSATRGEAVTQKSFIQKARR